MALTSRAIFYMESEANMPTIVLDPGHGQYGNQYPANKKFYEGTQMHILGEHLTAELKSYGFAVINTRPKLTDDPALSTRGNRAKGADLFLSLHSNAIGPSGSSATRGVEIYYSMTDPAFNRPFAEGLGKVIAETMQTPYRFARSQGMPTNSKRDYFQVVRSAAESGCKRAMLIEHGYHTNPTDTAFLVDSGRLKALAEAEAAYIAKQFNLSKPTMKPTEGIDVKPLNPHNYNDLKAIMVTCGAYVSEPAAQKVLERIRLIYPDAGLRAEKQNAVPNFHVVAGRYVGTLADARLIAADLEKLTGISSEAWAW